MSNSNLCLGSQRFQRLVRSARLGDVKPPADMRYLVKGIPKQGCSEYGESRSRIVTFLRHIYDSTAETLPDVRDNAGNEIGAFRLDVANEDAYSEAAKLQTLESKQVRVRKTKSSCVINLDHQHEERYLPPGHMKDYWLQMIAQDGQSLKPVPFGTFWKIWYEEFSFMKFRHASSHTQCGTCIRHKLLLKEMSGFIKAREEQQKLFANHLRAQYADRLQYWESRSASRERSPAAATLILDGMDQQKFLYPRASEFQAKELYNMMRPKAHISGLLLHGRLVLFSVAPSDMPKDSNSCIEMTAHAMHLLAQETDLSRLVLTVQSDNTPREVKNNHYIRFLTAMTSHGAFFSDWFFLVILRVGFCICVIWSIWTQGIAAVTSGIVRGAQLRMLRSGHSHEDVDQVFGSLASFLSRKARRATGPHEFRQIIQHWLDHELKRPHEPRRFAVMMDQVRDWIPGSRFW